MGGYIFPVWGSNRCSVPGFGFARFRFRGRDPLSWANTLNNLGIAYFDALDIDSALACFDRAIALDPAAAGPHFGRGEVRLWLGDYAGGWDGYAWRFRLPG